MAKKQTILKIEYEPDKDNYGGYMLGIVGIILSYVIVAYNNIESTHAFLFGVFMGILFMDLCLADEMAIKLKEKRG